MINVDEMWKIVKEQDKQIRRLRKRVDRFERFLTQHSPGFTSLPSYCLDELEERGIDVQELREKGL